MVMNEHARTVEATWRRMRPQEVAEMVDPEEFFTRIGEDIEAEIARRWPLLAGEDPPGEEHLAKVARLDMARFQAQSQVMNERLEELLGQESEDEEEVLEDLEDEEVEDSRDWLARVMGMGPRA